MNLSQHCKFAIHILYNRLEVDTTYYILSPLDLERSSYILSQLLEQKNLHNLRLKLV
jgi:hypothetical protein